MAVAIRESNRFMVSIHGIDLPQRLGRGRIVEPDPWQYALQFIIEPFTTMIGSLRFLPRSYDSAPLRTAERQSTAMR